MNSMRRALLCGLALVSCGAQGAPTPRFPAGSVWNQSIVGATLRTDSQQRINVLQGLGGWGPAGGVSGRMHIDFSFTVWQVPPGQSVPMFPIVEQAFEQDYYSPDCDDLGSQVPIAPGSAFEDDGDADNNPLTCENDGNDCHYFIVQDQVLYEVYSGSFDGAEVNAYCLATWDLNVVYPPVGRGDHCTSADAAGFPMAPLSPNADEVAAAVALPGNDADLGHAIRFILPNPRMASFPDGPDNGSIRDPLYVRPASHAGQPTGPLDTVPYGARLRLRDDYPMAGYSEGAQVVLRTMQRYGIVLSDGGNIALTFEGDRNTTAKWDDLDIFPQVFWNGTANNRRPVAVTDFAIIETGEIIPETYDCVRSDVVVGEAVFRNGFE